MTQRRLALPVLAAAALAVGACDAPGRHRSSDHEGEWRRIEGEDLIEVLPRDAIPALDEPVFVSAAEAEAFLEPDETVLGVVGRSGTARAYSTWHLDRHEIVNDELDGEPIAATW